MTENTKLRLNVSNKGREIIQKIDDRKFFGLNVQASSRSELYLFAMSLGLNGYPNDLESTDGLILIQNVEPRTKALMTAYSIYSEGTEDMTKLNDATKMENIISLSDKYTDIGLRIIEGAMSNYKSDEDYLWKLFKDIDEDFSKLDI